MNIKHLKIFSANIYSQFVTTVIQLLSVPLLLTSWTIDQYGDWVVIGAIPAYFMFSDGGAVQVASNKMTMEIARRNIEGANKAFSFAITAMLIGVGVVVSIGSFFFFEYYLNNGWTKFIVAVIFLVGIGIMTLSFALIDAAYGSTGYQAKPIFLSNTIRLLEWGAVIIGAQFGYGVHYCAGFMLLTRLILTIFIFIKVKYDLPQYKWTFNYKNLIQEKDLLRSSLDFLAFPVANAISIQGVIIIIGAIFGASAVVLYSTIRTLARLIIQLATMISKTVWRDISILYAKNDINKLRFMVESAGKKIIFISFSMSIIFIVFGGFIFDFWVKSKIQFNIYLLVIIVTSSFFNAVTQVKMVALMAVNLHKKLAHQYLMVAVLFAIFQYVFNFSNILVVAFLALLCEAFTSWCILNQYNICFSK